MFQTVFGITVDSKEGEKREGEANIMNVILKGKVEFNPQTDILGKTIERNRTSHRHQAGLKGL